jgi:hypothetical protein
MANLKPIRQRDFSERIFSETPLRNFRVRSFSEGEFVPEPPPPIETFYLITDQSQRLVNDLGDRLIYGNS